MSVFVGTYSHVVLDSIMHSDMGPLFPLSASNQLLGVVSGSALHKLCVYSGLLGAVMYFAVSYVLTRHNAINTDALKRVGQNKS